MELSGDPRQWRKITLDFEGRSVKEGAETFRDYRLDVTFVHAQTGMTMPGYFAADGAAADSAASRGDVWRVKRTWKAAFPQHDGGGYLNFVGDSSFGARPDSHASAPHAGAWRAGDPSCVPAC